MLLNHNKVNLLCLIIFLFINISNLNSQSDSVLSSSFEMRYFTTDPRANGETDFKGETAVFNTGQRVEFLQQYAGYAKKYFNDPNLDKLVVSDEEVNTAFRALKPQPLPQVRRRIPLTGWKFTGNKSGQSETDIQSIKMWTAKEGVEVRDGSLLFTGKRVNLDHPVQSQDWRMAIQWRLYLPRSSALPVRIMLGDAVEIGISENGVYYYSSAGIRTEGDKAKTDVWTSFKIELDLESGKYNWFVDDKMMADFVDLRKSTAEVAHLTIAAGKGLRIDDLWGVSYRKTYDPAGHHNTRDVPFSINTFIDENFEIRPDINNWNQDDYDDSNWKPVPNWPYAHGGERYRDEYLYLRKRLLVGEFDIAELRVEHIYPAGELWVNGKVVEVRHDPHPFSVDISKYLKPDAENLIAVKVYPNKVKYTMRHTPADEYSGWFAGRMWLDLKDKRRIKDVFVFTEKLEGNSATLGLEIMVRNDSVLHPDERERKGSNSFNGSLKISLYKWFPHEDSAPLFNQSFPIYVYLGQDKKWTGSVKVPDPELWTPKEPKLHKLVVQLVDSEGKVIDDEVVTTGIRTVSQEGGTFRINGKPEMMNGALIFAYREPMEYIAQWLRCSPTEALVSDLLMLKKSNANSARMSIHDGPSGSTNDPRYAEIADQLGIMFQWATTGWVRTDSPYLFDFEGFPGYIRQVRNHPSIVMWQPLNHPYFRNYDDYILWLEKTYDIITSNDRSRLISPTGSMTNARVQPRNDKGTLDHEGRPVEPVPVWTAPLITRGNMDFTLGYGAEWSILRAYPYPKNWEGDQNWRETGFRTDYLSSADRAYFDFESEETAGQPNWNLHKGKPQYQIQSYEYPYDEGSIGRRLTPDEWLESQAWQALGAYEAYRKKRWLDYDGLAWCPLRGGGNTATYQKPMIDYYGHAKLSFYTVRMSFQSILAGSNNVDIAYGPEDQITPIVMNLGDQTNVNLNIQIKTMDGSIIDQKFYSNIKLEGGRTFKTLDSWRPKVPRNDSYAVEYIVTSFK